MPPRETLTELRIILASIAAAGGDAAKLARRATKLVDDLIAAESHSVTRQRGATETKYVVERSSYGETLVERRATGKAQPIRCTKVVYDALVKVLAAGDKPVALDELMTDMKVVLTEHPPEFQVRVALRLWMHAIPPLVSRTRARYRPADQQRFTEVASTLWTDLSQM